jgi:Protein of unknown function (DUF3606)
MDSIIRERRRPRRITLDRPWEGDYWTHELGVSFGELTRLIGKVGNSETAVRNELGLTPKAERRPGR